SASRSAPSRCCHRAAASRFHDATAKTQNLRDSKHPQHTPILLDTRPAHEQRCKWRIIVDAVNKYVRGQSSEARQSIQQMANGKAGIYAGRLRERRRRSSATAGG